MTDEEENPQCPNCGKELKNTVDYVRGHKTSDGYKCNNDDCPDGWWSYEEWHESDE